MLGDDRSTLWSCQSREVARDLAAQVPEMERAFLSWICRAHRRRRFIANGRSSVQG